MIRVVKPALSFCVVLLSILLGVSGEEARACGAFASARRPAETEAELAARLPFLTVEQVLLVWDKDTGVEDFIRETRFDKANQTFGFVVPTPTKPEVAAVKKAPFESLRKTYPFEPPDPPRAPNPTGGLGGLGGGAGSGAGAEPPPVVVLSEQRIGSFTAFTLATTDAGAFDKWLDNNGFAMTEEARPWIARYIEQRFFFVALRYDPQRVGGAAADANADAGEGVTPEMTSETIRIRFKTPHPYYPYTEPALAKDATAPYSRMLTGWIVTREPMNAVAHRAPTEYESRRFRRPWTTGLAYRAQTEEIARVVGPELRSVLPRTAPSSPLAIQTFRDLKTRRTGFGDVLLVPSTPSPLSADDQEARRFLLTVMDPTLLKAEAPDAGVETPTPAALGASAASVSASPDTKRSTGCSSAPESSRSGAAMARAAIVVLFGLFVLRRSTIKRSRVQANVLAGALLLTACRPRSDSVAIDGSTDRAKTADGGLATIPQPAPTSARPSEPTREEKIQTVFTILSGAEPDGGIAVDPEQDRVRGHKGAAQVGATTVDTPVPNADRVVAGLRPRFRRCYEAGLNIDPSMSGKLLISAEIAPDGSVTKADASQNTGLSAAVATCCAGAVRRAQFDAPAGGKSSKLTIPISLVQQSQ